MTMITQFEKDTKELMSTMFKHNGYIKGYGDKKYRVMTADHSPIYNVNRDVVDFLVNNGELKHKGLVIVIK